MWPGEQSRHLLLVRPYYFFDKAQATEERYPQLALSLAALQAIHAAYSRRPDPTNHNVADELDLFQVGVGCVCMCGCVCVCVGMGVW